MNIGILGAGSWAIALSVLLEKNNHNVCMWEFNKDEAEMLKQEREHKTKLPGIIIPESITITNNLKDPFIDCDLMIVAVPAQTVRICMKTIESNIDKDLISSVDGWVIVSKGIEVSSGRLLTEIIAEELSEVNDEKLVVLSGPSHAEEVSRGVPTTVVAASPSHDLAIKVQHEFSNETFRIYTDTDMTGVELCASVKNVIAVAAGVIDGLGFGDNTKGALLTRGMVEITRLGKKMGANEMTFSGLAGFGDLITTCISKHSRNRKMGELLASGLSMDEALSKMTMVAEGVATTKSVYELAKKLDIDMPITTEIYKTLYEGKSPQEAVKDLMMRQLKPERV